MFPFCHARVTDVLFFSQQWDNVVWVESGVALSRTVSASGDDVACWYDPHIPCGTIEGALTARVGRAPRGVANTLASPPLLAIVISGPTELTATKLGAMVLQRRLVIRGDGHPSSYLYCSGSSAVPLIQACGGSSLNFVNLVIRDCGSSILQLLSSSASMVNVSVVNVTGSSPGAVVRLTRSSSLFMSRSSLSNVSCNDDGGVVHSVDSNVRLQDSSFRNVSSAGLGGVMYTSATLSCSGSVTLCTRLSDAVTVTDCTFETCHAQNGGVLAVSDMRLNVTTATFRNCSADDGGGVLFVSGKAIVDVSGVSAVDSSASFGGFVFGSSGHELSLSKSSIVRR